MPTFTRLLPVFFCFVFFQDLFSQNIAISYQNPNALYVCGADTLRVTLQNTTAGQVTNLLVTVTLPAGIEYLPGSVAGAVESDISNPNAPKFSAIDIAPGATLAFSLNLEAGCELIDAINSGGQFANTISVSYAGGNQQLTTDFFAVETALLFITSVTPVSQSGSNGDVLTRTITVRNTRQGPITEMHFSDQHNNGIGINLSGIGGQNAATLFEADVPGSYFSNFGDGDNLFEYNEIVTFTEEITVKDCGIPQNTVSSLIRVSWGCGATVCQTDSTVATVAIIPSNKNPSLVFISLYNPPASYCGASPSVQELLVINIGTAPATAVGMELTSSDFNRLGIQFNSFQINSGAGWMPFTPSSGEVTLLTSCDMDDYYGKVYLDLPDIAAGDTLRIRFETFCCQPHCQVDNVSVAGFYSYKKLCPEDSTVQGPLVLSPNESELAVNAPIYFDIGECLEDNMVYDFTYIVQSKRLLNTTGFLDIVLRLPWGLHWESDCIPILDGKSPVLIETDSIVNVNSTIRLAYPLPFSQDSVSGGLCLRYHCDASVSCAPPLPNPPPRGEDYLVYPTAAGCSQCILKVVSETAIIPALNTPTNCGVLVCDAFELVVNNSCDTTGGGGGGGGGGGLSGLNLSTATFDSYRVNAGLRDNNNDRTADDFSPADAPNLRLDRFLPGDTMRTEFRVSVQAGNLSEVHFRLFMESLESDFGENDGDIYVIGEGKKVFVNYDETEYIGGELTIITAAGQQYGCPIGVPLIKSDQHIFTLLPPNVRPADIIDELSSMFHQFDLDLGTLASTGCVPSGFVLSAGDSMVFKSDFKFRQNFTPASQVMPPLVNFRNTICDLHKIYAWNLPGCMPHQLRQYSGYIERIIPPLYEIESCGEATELSPFRYSIRIARENMFPYEVRRLAAILDFRHSLLPGVSFLEAQLNYFNLQESIPLFGSQLLTPNISNDIVQLDFQPFFMNPLDEGFSLETSLKFGPNCFFNGPVSAKTNLTTRYFSDEFHDPDPFMAEIVNPAGYTDGLPELMLEPEDQVIDVPGEALELDLALSNVANNLSPNTWLSWETTGDLTGVELFLLPQQQSFAATGGVFHLGDIQPFTEIALRLKGQLKACEPVLLTLRYGWDCAPVTNPGGSPCGYYERSVELRPVFPELELVVLTQPADVQMCAPSDIFEFEIYNAAEGVALDVLGSVKLPPGLTVVPNASRLSYPAGTPFVNLADAVVLPGNVWQWTPGNASAALASNGLQSIDDEPDNALRIRFRVQATCGFVANTRPIYGAEGVQPCGANSNILRKPGNPVQLEGFGPSYDVTASLVYANVQDGANCGESSVLAATLILDGTPGAGDSMYVVLPPGVSYVGGSYQPGQNAPGGPPQIAGNTLQLPFPANLPANATVQFNIAVNYDNAAGCADQVVILQARESISVFCPLINQNCAVYIATGEALLFLQVKNPDLVLQNFETALNNNTLSFSANLSNEGTGTATEPLVQFYLDQNGNGQVDTNEPLVATHSPGSPVAPGTSLPLAGNLGVPPSALCQLLAFIPASENCACSDKTFPVNQNPVVHSVVGFCEVMSATFGVDSVAGSMYTWLTPDGLSCTNCAQTNFTPGPGIQPGDVVALILEEKTGTCTIEHRFEVRFGGELELQTPDQFICEGESVQLEATPGGTYQWSGPGLTNPNNAIQIIQPEQTSTYSVTITFNGGCTGTGQVQVTVFQKDSLDLGSIVTCPGNLVNVFGTPTDQPGFYTQNLQNTDGCDSVSFLRLIVFPPETYEVWPICPGDSIVVYDSVFTEAGKSCRSFVSTAGCDSMHCITVEVLPELVVPAVQDSFVISAGEEIQLQAPAGFVSYAWTPTAGLSCADCPDPLASPDTSTVYLLTVADPNGCFAAVTYRVLLCDFDKLNIPNAFTPNGDGVNDVFRIVPVENLAEVRSLTIYNRWGQKVWEGAGLDAEWDGTIDGKPAASDVYVWLLRGGCGGELREKKGDVGLLR